MLDSKFIFTLVGLIATVMAICKTNFNPSIKENFWNVSGAPRQAVAQVIQTNGKGGAYAVHGNTQAMLGSGKFLSYPSFQSNLSPRFSPIGYGPYINYDPPAYKNQGVPYHPTGYGDMVKENYQETKENYSCGSCDTVCSTGNCQTSGNPTGLPGSGVAAPPAVDYINAANKMYDQHGEEYMSSLPMSSMETVGIDGNTEQVLNLDRYMFANQKSKLAALGCPVRGDLPIANCNTGWFNPAVNPAIDLKTGFMNVAGGTHNETANSLAELQYAVSGGVKKISSGVDLGNEFASTLGAGQTDINVTAFV